MKKIFLLFAAIALTISTKASEPVKKAATPIDITKADFIEKVHDYEKNPQTWKYKGDKPAIIDFWAKWCGPCRTTNRILKSLAEEYGDEIYIYKIDVDRERELAASFNVQSIPTFIFVPMGENPQIAVGALSEEAFKEVIDQFLLKKESAKKQ